MNVLVIGVDQMRFDTPGCLGMPNHAETPALDALARRGTLFENAYTTCPLCSPARASIFTGQHAFHHRMCTNCDMYQPVTYDLERPQELLHNAFLRRGYDCLYEGKWHVCTHAGPVDLGFQGMNSRNYGNFSSSPDFLDYLEKNGYSRRISDPVYYNNWNQTLGAGVWDGPEESTPEYYLAQRTIDALTAQAKTGRPFFMTCQFWGPHGPHLPPRSYVGRNDRSRIVPWENMDDDLRGKAAIIRRELDFYACAPETWPQWREIIGLYLDFSSFIDSQIGRILSALDDLGLRDDTLVFFESDHGDMTGAHGGSIDKGFLYEEAMRVPMIAAGPGIRSGVRTKELVYNMDILPTAMDMLDMPIPETVDARSLKALLSGGQYSGRDQIYLEFHGLRFLYSQRGLITADGMKYILSAGDFDEVYDLNADPWELHNVIEDPAYAGRVADLKKRMMDQAAAVRDPLANYICKIFGQWNHPAVSNWLPTV